MYKKIMGVCIVLAVTIGVSFFRIYPVSGDCMEPAVKDGSICIGNRLLPFFRNYQVGDIIFFKQEEKMWISRIVALRGDVIFIQENTITRNGTVVQDGVCRNWDRWKLGTFAVERPYVVPKDTVFVLSDNLSAAHDDSRVFGPISTKDVVGLISFICNK